MRQVKGGVLLEIKVKPNSNQTRLFRKDEGFILELKSPPENNKANIEAIRYLESLFGKEVRIIRGFKSKNKVFLLTGLKEEHVQDVMKDG
ncbi:MAG TPA: DUF167 domain-containing protein [archaeon]|nr:DUF167 domain-containing protein [archaeon]